MPPLRYFRRNLMQIFLNPLPLIFFCALIALHFVSGAFSTLIEKIIKYANVALHIILFFVLMLYLIPLEEVALLYLFSLLFYLLAYLFWNVLCAPKKADDAQKGGEAEK